MNTKQILPWFQLGLSLMVTAALGAEPAPATPQPGVRRPTPKTEWLDPDKSEPAGTHYRTFKSTLVGGEVSYLVYLPPDYETNTTRRYPVVYFLHGYGGNQRAGAVFVQPLDECIRAGKAPPMIAILVNGIAASFYRDEPSGKRPVESVIIKELIPHVDQTYRTVAKREARSVEGFSMGGFGAGHLGFKYPEVFGLVGIMAGAMCNWAGEGMQPPPRDQTTNMSAERKAFLAANHPYTLAQKNAEALRGRTAIRIAVGDQDDLMPYNEALDKILTGLQLDHAYEVVPGVAHDSRKFYRTLGERAFAWYRKAWSGRFP
ncbi:MAG: alpha/beta hydrolase-fold protein [Kiritimatiellaeota bacterium]|nr:alpha/beta hydrolase-fold protein [Kiritimatiellota bacterium]